MDNQEAELLKNFSDMDTDYLLSKWQTEERLPWADDVLRSVLLERGLTLASLDKARARRMSVADASSHAKRTPVFVYRFLTFFLAIGFSRVAGGSFGTQAGYFAAFAVFLFYAGYLIHRIHKQDEASGLSDGLWGALHLAEVAVIVLGFLYFVYVTFSG